MVYASENFLNTCCKAGLYKAVVCSLLCESILENYQGGCLTK